MKTSKRKCKLSPFKNNRASTALKMALSARNAIISDMNNPKKGKKKEKTYKNKTEQQTFFEKQYQLFKSHREDISLIKKEHLKDEAKYFTFAPRTSNKSKGSTINSFLQTLKEHSKNHEILLKKITNEQSEDIIKNLKTTPIINEVKLFIYNRTRRKLFKRNV